MPSAWNAKDERMFEHIRDSAEARGSDDRRAAEIAARTVNKHRREEGRTPNRRTQGSGNPDLPLAERSKDELMNLARERGLKGRSAMTKAQLVQALQA
ncbi:Rho termination factor N-terminal domain-containing protein [Derxia lacustris]|uniref:Rho termination factor N-terminal domain-containing protein n=1 Tax=Derxia lacustris TaxID=764842 RepID=UPI000A17670E|nr:Rho termination factor N-terminal domain-containing protein [Derxia lacustris]